MSSSTRCALNDIAGFWSALLERPVNDGANQFVAMIPASADGSFPALMFLAVPEPRHGKNRMLGCGRHRSQNSCSPANGRANHTHRLADKVSLSITRCQRRVRDLEASGAIRGYRAVVTPGRCWPGLRGACLRHRRTP